MHDISYYKTLQNARGSMSAKQTALRKVQKSLEKSFHKTLNWEKVKVGAAVLELQVVKGANERERKINTRPHERLWLGAVAEWSNAYWLVTKMSADRQIQCEGEMTQCNTVLRWQLADGHVYQEYGVSEDATKYGTGISDTAYLTTNEFSLKVKLPMNAETLKLGRDKRFLIGQFGEGVTPYAYAVTRVNPVTNDYTQINPEENAPKYQGLIELTLQQDQYREQTDRRDLGIADYNSENAPTPPPKDESEWF